MNCKELRSFSHFQIFNESHTQTLAENLKIDQILEFFFIHCKTVKVSQNDQIRM